MYATRLLSMYKRNPSALSDQPPSGPNSGYLVIFDEEAQTYSCFGLCKDKRIKDFPFPQNKNLTINCSSGENTSYEEAIFLPVLNQPLSSNRYYVIRRKGKNQGQASTSSKEEDKTSCLCCSFVHDVKPRPLEPFNDYQQVKIIKKRHGFHAKSIASDGIPSGLLRENGWSLYARTPHNYHLKQALGSNDSLRSKLPNFDFPMSNDRSESVVVGKWYCPFMFVKERMKLKEQMKMSMFYEVTLEQRWEAIFSKENENNGENNVLVDVAIQTEVAKVARREAVWDENRLVDGVLWFKSVEHVHYKCADSRPKLVAGSAEGYSGHVDGKLREARMNHPKGITVDDRGNIYVADIMNMAIRKISDSGITTIAGGKLGRGGGHVDGPSEEAKFSNDFDVVYVGSSCSLLVIDRGNQAIREIQLRFDDCAYQYESGFPLGIAMLIGAGFFGYMLALLQRRLSTIVASQDAEGPVMSAISPSPYQKPLKSVRPPLIPSEDETYKQEEGLFGSIGKLLSNAGASVVEIMGFRKKPQSYEFQSQPLFHQPENQVNGWPVQESFVISNEDEPPSIDPRTPTPKKTYPFMSKDAEKMQQLWQGRAIYNGWDGDLQQQKQQQKLLYSGWDGNHQQQPQQQQQQQKLLYSGWEGNHQQQSQQQQQQQKLLYSGWEGNHQQPQQQQQQKHLYNGWDGDLQQQQQKHHYHYQHHSSVAHTYYEQSREETNEIVFGAVQEQDKESVVIKPLDYGDSLYDHSNMRSRISSIGYIQKY